MPTITTKRTLQIALLWTVTGAGHAAVHSLAAIEAAVRSHVDAELGSETDIEYSVGRLDPRLRLPACASTLLTRFAHQRPAARANAVEVRCEGAKPWSLYVPVEIARYASVAVAVRTLPRGTVVAASDVALERRRLAGTRAGFVSDPALVAGQVTTRTVQAGQVLSVNTLRRPRLVKRGQRVVLTTANPAIKVRVSGKALEDGAAGERISVRNLSSERVIEGVVSPRGLVVVSTGSVLR